MLFGVSDIEDGGRVSRLVRLPSNLSVSDQIISDLHPVLLRYDIPPPGKEAGNGRADIKSY